MKENAAQRTSRKIEKDPEENETSWAAGTDDDPMFEKRKAARRCTEQGVLAV